MNIPQMLNHNSNRKKTNEIPPVSEVQKMFKGLSESDLKEMIELARRQGIDNQSINEGVKMIQALR